MPASDKPIYLYEEDGARARNWPWFTVTIAKNGPRGGKRPPLIKARLRAYSYDDAVEIVKNHFFAQTDITVTY